MSDQERAERSAQVLWAADKASQALGMALHSIGPGKATLTMTVTDTMLNGHGIGHGGYVFTLADSAFAFACNSYNRPAVAQSNQITYLSPAQLGETLTARAQEAGHTGRTGVYDVTVTGADGRTIALMRGQSRTLSGQHFEED